MAINIAELVVRLVDITSSNKPVALNQLADVAVATGLVTDPVDFKTSLFNRESIMSTGLGRGLAIPHARCACVQDFFIVVGRCPDGMVYEAIDDVPVKLLFLIAIPSGREKTHLELLATLVDYLQDRALVEGLLKARDLEEVHALFLAKQDIK